MASLSGCVDLFNRAAEAETASEKENRCSSSPASLPPPTSPRPAPTGFTAEAAEFQSWPYEAIIQIASPDDAQRSALEALRASTTAAAERLSAGCPRDEPAPSGERLVAAEQAIDTVTASYAAVEPPLRAFFAALDDEQKARLLRDLSSSGPQAREGDRTPQRGERRTKFCFGGPS